MVLTSVSGHGSCPGFTQCIDQGGALILIIPAADRLSGRHDSLSASGRQRIVGIAVHLLDKLLQAFLSDWRDIVLICEIHHDAHKLHSAILSGVSDFLEDFDVAATPGFDILAAASS